jgi:hypothetical protein
MTVLLHLEKLFLQIVPVREEALDKALLIRCRAWRRGDS